MKRLSLLSIVIACSLYGGGYKIPEVSTNGVALSAANVAHSHGADAAFYNPANMVYMEDVDAIDANLIYIGLDDVKFKGSGAMTGVDINAKSENFIIPSIQYVSGKLGNARVGLSIDVPGGLTKRWKDAPAIRSAEEFSLEVIEINPSVAFPLSDTLSVAAGFRIIHSEGVVKSSYIISRDMTGEGWDYGYNLALSYKPTKSIDFAVTYRSKISLDEKGSAKLYAANILKYSGGATVSVPLPAALNIAMAYTFDTQTTVEFVYERNYWSAYKTLDFNYAGNIGSLKPFFDDPMSKNWKDASAYRVGITQRLDALTLMAGAVIDKSPVPDNRLSFELPDSDSLSVSFGVRYEFSKNMDFGISALYSMREERSVSNANLSGEFSNSNVLIVSTGLGYKF